MLDKFDDMEVKICFLDAKLGRIRQLMLLRVPRSRCDAQQTVGK